MIKWRMQLYDAAGTGTYELVVSNFCDAISSMSNGRLEITPYGGDTLVPTKEMLDAITSGLLDAARSNCGYWGGTMPEGAAINVVINAPSWLDETIMIHNKGLLPIVRTAYAQHNSYLVGTTVSASNYMWFKEALTSLDDIKGRKVRGYGGFCVLLEKMGVSSVSLSHGESYMALQLGTIEGYISGCNRYLELKHYEMCPYFVVNPLGFGINDVHVNMDKWNALPDDLKAIVEAATYSMEYAYGRYAKDKDNELVNNTSKYGTTLVTLPASDIQEMRRYASELWEEEAQRNEGAAQIISIMRDYFGIQ